MAAFGEALAEARQLILRETCGLPAQPVEAWERWNAVAPPSEQQRIAV